MSAHLGSDGTPPQAVRSTRPGWRDPRLWLGVAIVAASVVLGARVFAAADDTVEVWALTEDAGVGDTLTPEDLQVHRVRFGSGEEQDRYFLAEEALPDEVTLLRGVGAGELLPRSAVGSNEDAGTVDLSVEVPPALLPTTVQAGSVVDVHLVGGAPAGEGQGAAPVEDAGPGAEPDADSLALTGATVVDLPTVEDSFGPAGGRQVVLAAPAKAVQRFFARLQATENPVVWIVRRPR